VKAAGRKRPAPGKGGKQCLNDAGCGDRRGQPVRGDGPNGPLSRAARVQNNEIRAISEHSAESARAAGEASGVSRGVLKTTADGGPARHRRGRVTVKGPAPSRDSSPRRWDEETGYKESARGRDMGDARAMPRRRGQGVHSADGLQARRAPAISSSSAADYRDGRRRHEGGDDKPTTRGGR